MPSHIPRTARHDNYRRSQRGPLHRRELVPAPQGRCRGRGHDDLRSLARPLLTRGRRPRAVRSFRSHRRQGPDLRRQPRLRPLHSADRVLDAPVLRRSRPADNFGHLRARGRLPHRLFRDRGIGRGPGRAYLARAGRTVLHQRSAGRRSGFVGSFKLSHSRGSGICDDLGRGRRGPALREEMGGHPASTSCLAWSETWFHPR